MNLIADMNNSKTKVQSCLFSGAITACRLIARLVIAAGGRVETMRGAGGLEHRKGTAAIDGVYGVACFDGQRQVRVCGRVFGNKPLCRVGAELATTPQPIVATNDSDLGVGDERKVFHDRQWWEFLIV